MKTLENNLTELLNKNINALNFNENLEVLKINLENLKHFSLVSNLYYTKKPLKDIEIIEISKQYIKNYFLAYELLYKLYNINNIVLEYYNNIIETSLIEIINIIENCTIEENTEKLKLILCEYIENLLLNEIFKNIYFNYTSYNFSKRTNLKDFFTIIFNVYYYNINDSNKFNLSLKQVNLKYYELNNILQIYQKIYFELYES